MTNKVRFMFLMVAALVIFLPVIAHATGSISGRVTDSGRTGIQNVWIVVDDSTGYYNVISSDTDTDSNGNYTVSGIPTGSYKIWFGGSSVGYINEFYNDKTYSTADLVPVTAPNTTTGIDAVLALGGSISGRVTDSGGTGIQNFSFVYVYDANDSIEWVSTASADLNGNYIAKGIPTGSFKVWFLDGSGAYVGEYYNDKTDFITADTVSVTAPDTTTGIDAELALAGFISGRVTDGTNGIQNVLVYVYDTNNNYISNTYTDTNGNYTAGYIPTGNYKVQFDGTSLGYISEYYSDRTYSTADLVSVTAGNTTPNIDAVLALGGSISGRVTDSSGTGIQNIVRCINHVK
ncbi:MAG: carboxypeptidase regulatory-like domain-containing protein [Nitrospirae bacterium]|nr:carboxypeptidase regulatory-like domain-containing protein [Nitrospirota bacterium]